MDADELQARPVALEKLCKEPEKDGPHLLVLENTHRPSNSYSEASFDLTIMCYCQ